MDNEAICRIWVGTEVFFPPYRNCESVADAYQPRMWPYSANAAAPLTTAQITSRSFMVITGLLVSASFPNCC